MIAATTAIASIATTSVGAAPSGLRGMKESGAIGPRWTYDPNWPMPNGTKNMGTYTIRVYTPAQQKEFG